jgi:hypothetical protein
VDQPAGLRALGGAERRRLTVSAQRAEPQPYWRPYVSDNMYYHPDIVNATSYTICWQGVVSPYVCTSGAKICW